MTNRPLWGVVALVAVLGCKKSDPAAPAANAKAVKTVGLVTDIGGRGDQSFNDSALRGLELWSAGARFSGGKYEPLPPNEVAKTVPEDLKTRVEALGVKPLVVQSKAQEDYQPNLGLLVDQGADLVVGTGFMLENAVEAVAKTYPNTKFLLIDSPILDSKGQPAALPNVRTVVFKEEEGSYLAGALAGLVAKEKVGFVGGMEIPLIKKFEAGFRAGVKTTNPKAVVLATYTGSFDNVAAGKQVAQDLIAKGAEIVFHAAGSDGLGAIQAVKEAREAGKKVFAIGVDSDQAHLAPDAVLTSMVKRVDLAVWEATKDLVDGKFSTGDRVMGLKQGGVSLAPVTLEFPEKAAALQRVAGLREQIVAGTLKVPSNIAELESFTPPN
jgi:basic membrane protein A and related proteins